MNGRNFDGYRGTASGALQVHVLRHIPSARVGRFRRHRQIHGRLRGESAAQYSGNPSALIYPLSSD